MEEKKIYVISDDYYEGLDKLVKLTDAQARAIDWVFSYFEDMRCRYGISKIEELKDIDEP
jgi:hypothetical protein